MLLKLRKRNHLNLLNMGLLGIGSIIASSMNAKSQNNLQVQALRQQKKENESTREHNLYLAKLNNQWNIEQWQRQEAALERERGYNSPAAQKARLQAAGLNADLMYGQGGVSNVSTSGVSSSAPMTAGAPATPMDWSSLANRKTIGNVINEVLDREMMQAQIDSIKADTKKTLADAGLSEISLEYADAEKRLGLKMSEQEFEKAKQDYELGVQAVTRNAAELEGVTLDNAYKAIRNAFESEAFQKQTEIFAEELKIKKVDAKYAQQYYAAKLLGLEADNAWKDAAWIVQQKEGTATLIKYGSEAVLKLVDGLSRFIPNKSKKPRFGKK